MNTNLSITRKFKRMFANILAIFVILAMAFPAMGSVSAQDPAPTISISTSNNYLRADNFTPNAMVTFTVYEDQGSSNVVLEISRNADDAGYVFIDGWEHSADLVVDNYVVATDGINEKQLVLEPLTIEVFDPDTDFVAGIASPGRSVWVVVGNNTVGYPAGMAVDANADGVWTADFAQVYDFSDDMWGSAHVSDEDGDATVFHKGPPPPPPNPRIVASITYNWFRAEQFSPGVFLNVKIYDEQGGNLLWEDNRIADDSGFIFVGEWEHPVDLAPGNYMVISDGTTTKDLVLEAVTLDVFDPSTDYLGGTAPPEPEGRFVWVGTGNENYGCSMDVTADPVSGAWTADFSTQPCDVTEDMWGAAQVFDADGDASEANPPPPPPNPRFVVFPEWEWFDGLDWPDGAIVSISVDGKTECYLERESWGGFFNGNFPEDCDVQIGDTVTFTDGETVRTHTVRNLAVTKVDQEDDTVKGIADVGAQVYVWPHATGQEQLVIAKSKGEAKGKWNADFTGIFDLVPGECGRSEIRDESGNATAVDWCIPNPRFSAFPEWEYIEGWEWPLGANIHLTINDLATDVNPDFEQNQPVVVTPWDPNGVWVSFSFAGEYDMKPGDVVTLTDGVTSRMHIAQNLAITDVAQQTNIITGTADPGAMVHVWPHGYDELLPTTDENGIWLADFNTIGIDLMEGMGGRTEIRDEVGNATAVEWYISNPRFVVFPEWEWFDGNDWPDGATVTITVEDKPECTTTKESWGGFFNGSFGEGCDIVIGDSVTFTDGTTVRTHTVQDLAITAVDKNADMVAGTANVGATVYAWVHGYGETELHLTVEDGTWLANFGSVPFDLQEGMCGRSEIRDEIGNATAVDWCIPNPVLAAFPEWEYIEGWNWILGANVHLTIDDPATEANPDYEQDQPVVVTPWDPNGVWVTFNFAGEYDMKAGDIVTLSDGTTTRTHTIQNLVITAVDVEANTVAGTADEGANVFVWPHATGEQTMATADVAGNWQVDFTDVFDLVPGECGRSEIRDAVGNATAVDWCVPWSPRIVVQITDDWFRAENFQPNTTLEFWIYDALGGNLLSSATTEPTDGDGTVTHWVGDQVDLVPGNYLVIADGKTTREIVLEALTFDVFDTSLGVLQGTAPEPSGRAVTVGIGCWKREDLTMNVITSENGDWTADFGAPVPNDFGCVYAQVFDSQGNASEVRPSRIFPMLFAWLEWDKVDGHGWREGETITLTIGDLVLTQVAGSSTIVFDVGAAGHDLTIGDVVQMSDGLITKELQIPEVKITDYDLGANTISGLYDPMFGFRTSVFGQEVVDIAFDGNLWTAYFDDLKPLQWGDVVQRDADSDEVAATIRTPNPVFYAVPDEERIYATEWSPGQSLIVNINGVEIASQVIPDHGNPYGSEVMFDLNGNFDLQAGQIVSLTDGRSTKNLMVATLQVIGFDLGTHTIFGIADPGPLFISVNGEDMWITVGEDGIWEASSLGFDPLEWGSVIKTDDDGDQTRDIFMIPRPMLYAFPEDDVVTGVVWTEGQPLTLRVYDAETGEITYERTEIVPPPSVVPWTAVHFYLRDAGYDLKPGDRLVMSQNGYERELIISSVQITEFDLTTQTVFGTGDPGADFLIRIDGLDIRSTVMEDGTWSVYHELLQPGVWGEAIQPDIDGDETRDGFQAPYE